MIRFRCPACAKVLKAPDHGAGQKIPCPRCGQRLEVPSVPKNKTTLGVINSPSTPSPSLDQLEEVSQARHCPYCAEEINPEALKCRHCGEMLDPALREALLMSEGQADGVGLIAITCAAMALIGTIIGLFFCGYGTLIGVPIALGGLIVSIFATRHKKTAMILNATALVPPVVLGTIVILLGAAFMGICCAGGAMGPDSQKHSPRPVNEQPLKRK